MSVNHRSTDEQWHNIAYQALRAEDQTSLFPRLPAVPPVCVHDYHCIRTSAGVGTGARQIRRRAAAEPEFDKQEFLCLHIVRQLS